ncbi:MAG: tetratricopeptide repeat protein [Candidatus Thorarchaeota archaeon]
MVQSKIPGTIYSLILKRVDASNFELALEFRGKIESSCIIAELDEEVVAQRALQMIEEYRIPASEPAIRTLVRKMSRRFSKKRPPPKAKAEQPPSRKKPTMPPRPREMAIPSVAPAPTGDGIQQIAEELSQSVQGSSRARIATPDAEVASLVAQLDEIKGKEEDIEIEPSAVVTDQLFDMKNALDNMLIRVSQLIKPLQGEIQQIANRLTLLERKIPEQGNINLLEAKIQSFENRVQTFEAINAKVATLEAALLRLETQRPLPQAQETAPISTDTVPVSDSDSKYAAITRSESFQDLLEFSEQLDETAPPRARAIPEAIPDLLKHVQELWKDGRRQQAIQLLENASYAHQTDAELLLLLGKFHLRDGHIHEAVDAYNRALSFFPDDPHVLVALGDAYTELELHEKAVEYLKRAQLINPNDEAIGAKLSTAYMRLGQQEEAMGELKSFVEKTPDPEDASADYGQSSEPLSLSALKDLDVTKASRQQAADQPSPKKPKVKRQEIEKRKEHLKALLDLESKKDDS